MTIKLIHGVCIEVMRSILDGPRYKSVGNSMAVPVMRWLGEKLFNELAKGEV